MIKSGEINENHSSEENRKGRIRRSELLRIRREKRGIKVRILLDEKFETTPEYFEGIINCFLRKNEPLPKLLDDVCVERQRKGFNSLWFFVKRRDGVLGTIGQVFVDQINDEYSQIMIRSMDSYLPSPSEDYGQQVYKKSIWFLHAFACYLRKEFNQPLVGKNNLDPFPVIRTIQKVGRKHFKEDIWAHDEFIKHPERRKEIFENWINNPGVINRKLRFPDRQFREIIKKEWNKEEKVEIG